jgi:SAM-dependent methyltransferase
LEQDKIWDHFQTEGVDSFVHARGRYAAMAAEARRRLGRSGGRVLNIGVGPGVLERLFLARGWHVAGGGRSAPTPPRITAFAIDARCGYAQQMPFESDSFDVVVASEVLEHLLPDIRRQVLVEIARVLKQDGWFIGSVPYREVLADQQVICPDCSKVFHRWGHVSSFDIPDLRAELSETFAPVSCRRRSLVDWSAARTPLRLVKAMAQSLLGRMGEAISSPSIIFAAKRRGNG